MGRISQARPDLAPPGADLFYVLQGKRQAGSGRAYSARRD